MFSLLEYSFLAVVCDGRYASKVTSMLRTAKRSVTDWTRSGVRVRKHADGTLMPSHSLHNRHLISAAL